jgi:hypothetical protein
MPRKKFIILMSLLMSLTVWLIFSWPLPRHISDGIPLSSTNIEKGSMRYMIPGDHLQLRYFYWLFNDMLHGHTPFFQNIYEFNLGDDGARFRVGNYNVPFSFIYAFWALFGNSSFAWNMMGLTLIWITSLLTWILARRFTDDNRIAAVAALISITLPYRWMNLFGGSPMGMAMTWVPLLFLGCDMAVRDRSIKGGLLMALALIGTFYTDTHIFFFTGLFLPLWGVIGLLRSDLSELRERRTWFRIILAVMPIAITCVLLLLRGWMLKQSHLGGTAVDGGRAISEVAIFTATPMGLIQWQACGKQAHIYLGWLLPALLLGGSLVSLLAARRKPHRIALIVAGLLILHAVGIVILAVGVYGPFHGKLYELFRDYIPGYSMMRQPGKIFSLLPTILAMAAAVVLTLIKAIPRISAKTFSVMLALAAAGIIFEYGSQVRITICLLEREQPAYAAIRADADRSDGEARAMIIPFWPGDSAWGSVYQYYVSLYHIKMINGYSPVVPKSYVTDIYEKLGRSNIGVLPDDLLDNLLQRNIRYIVLHENAFPEQVSPFPVGFTLKRLLNHPRLTLLKHAQHIWSFRIEKTARPKEPLLSDWQTFFPAREWEFENCATAGHPIITNDAAVSGGRYLILDNPAQCATSRLFRVWQAPQSRLSIRARGQGGALLVELQQTNGVSLDSRELTINATNWQWYAVALTNLPERTLCAPVFKALDGSIQLDVMQYNAGSWNPPKEGEALRLAPGIFFHAGHLTDDMRSVKLRRDSEPDDYIFYGICLPLPKGRYSITMEYSSPAFPGTKLGEISVKARSVSADPVAVIAGEKAVINFDQTANLPLRFNFKYTRNHDLTITGILLTRQAEKF